MRAYFTDRNVRRLLVLLVFLGLVWWFRHLLLLLIFFVIFERTISLLAGYLSAATKLKFKYSVIAVVLTLVGAVVGGVWFGIAKLVENFGRIQHSVKVIIETIRHSELYHRYGSHGGSVTPARILEQAQHHSGEALAVAAEVGRAALYVFIALIFAVVFLLEREHLESWREKMKADSPARILLRYMRHVADAIAITVKLQVIVAVVSALITLPVLLALRLPGIPALMAMLLIAGLIPVVGGPVAGAVLMIVAYVTRGPVGLGVFVASTFILHKIESYYLTPKLTAKHVHLPSFVIIVSLVLFEHTFGLIGLFLSFPCLYVAAKVREGWVDPADEAREDEETTRAMRGILPSLKGIRPRAALRALGERQARAVAKDVAPPAPPPDAE